MRGRKRKIASTDELLARTLAELQRLSADGIAPSLTCFDAQRDQRLPMSGQIKRHLKLSYIELCRLAGLKPRPRASGSKKQTAIAQELPWRPDDIIDTEAESLPRPGLAVCAHPRIHILHRRLPNGQTIRTTREFHLVR